MPQVLTGKVVIPGDKTDEYLTILAEAEKSRRPFRPIGKSAKTS